jgi:hypothetical protein
MPILSVLRYVRWPAVCRGLSDRGRIRLRSKQEVWARRHSDGIYPDEGDLGRSLGVGISPVGGASIGSVLLLARLSVPNFECGTRPLTVVSSRLTFGLAPATLRYGCRQEDTLMSEWLAISDWQRCVDMARPGIIFEIRNGAGQSLFTPCTAQLPPMPFDWKSPPTMFRAIPQEAPKHSDPIPKPSG